MPHHGAQSTANRIFVGLGCRWVIVGMRSAFTSLGKGHFLSRLRLPCFLVSRCFTSELCSTRKELWTLIDLHVQCIYIYTSTPPCRASGHLTLLWFMSYVLVFVVEPLHQGHSLASHAQKVPYVVSVASNSTLPLQSQV